MDIEQLRTFLEVKNTRHFGKAANNLFITQAAVSARVRQLEELMGVKLFLRQRNNLQLTAEGERFVQYAETMLQTWQMAKQEVGLRAEQLDQLAIAAAPGICRYFLQDKLEVLQSHFPALAFRIDSLSSSELVPALLHNLCDLAFMYEPVKLEDLVDHKLAKLRLVMASSEPDKNIKTAFDKNYIYMDWGNSFTSFHQNKFGELKPFYWYTNTPSVAEQLLDAQPATAYMPEKFIEQRDSLHRVEKSPAFSRNVYAVLRRSSAKAPIIEKVSKLLKTLES